MGAYEAGGLVKEEQHALRVIERFSIHEHVRGIYLRAVIVGSLSAHGHMAIGEPIARLSARTVAKVGEELIEAAHAPQSMGFAASMLARQQTSIQPTRRCDPILCSAGLECSGTDFSADLGMGPKVDSQKL
jgi:hypothetical protein